MKIAALLCGLLASAFAWGANYVLVDLSQMFLTLWPVSNSQQLLGLVAWHAIVGAALVGGLLTVFVPLLGALLLLAAAGAWAWLGLTLPVGFAPQIAVPLAFAALGGLAALGALVRGRVRRTSRRGPSEEDLEREEALRLEPDDELARAVEVRQGRKEPPISAASSAADEAIGVGARPAAEAGPPRGLSVMFVANVALLLVLTGAVALLLYVELRSGQLAAAFSGATAVVATSTDAITAASSDAAAAAATEAADVAAIEAATPDAESGDAGVATAEIRVSSQPLDVTQLPPQQWTDPFEYCAAMGNMDYPDHRYAGPLLPTAVATALRVPESSPPDRARWRCADGQVLICRSFRGVGCAMTPTVSEMRTFCEQNPNSTDLWAPNGTWSCVETVPELPPGASWPVDARGFLPGAWVALPAPAPEAPST